MTPPPFLLILITFLLLRNSSSRVAAQCGLNLSAYPYVGYAECGWVQDQMDHWDGFPNTLCCRNALTVFSQALALRARTQTSLFIPDTEWHSCSDAFRPSQAISPDSCGFHNLYLGAFKCSNLKLSDIQSLPFYQPSLDQCSHFDRPSPDSCAHCVSAVLNIRDSLYDQLVGSQDIPVERAVCGVASLVSLAAGKPDDPSLSDKFLRCWPPPPNHVKSNSVELHAIFMLVIALLAVIAMALTAILVRCVWQKKPREAAALKEITTWSGMYWFSKAEIENAISHGNERKCLGRGSAGQVFRGVLPSGQVVAIKHLNKTNSSDSFTREVEGLSRLRHPNLVCLFGCCIEDGERYLVYEYCAQGNLAQHLLRRDSHLTWETRVRILRDCSFALKYLHNHIEGCVVHRDIKLTNILLTESLQAKLSDFGLAKMLGMEESKVFTDVRGTIGYMDPEYMSNAKLTCASDVYSFGIVALQILSGQKVIELDLDARDQLTRKARDASSQKRPISDFEDPRLRGQVNMADFEAILRIAVLCVAKSSKGRPTIEEVFEELDKAYKNTLAQSKAKQDESKSGTSDLIIT
ncbi:probable receptor-like protein kinase At3g17420 [Neltuma alba]|uniref:probable receptor-like protein kinase At3g17420 n=1 Tax=Neltuma alba TaxID=207710 RepID=UPI0010A2CC6F|nr:probable receptor-like protein kinase At3g17420 [Prosopis alba]